MDNGPIDNDDFVSADYMFVGTMLTMVEPHDVMLDWVVRHPIMTRSGKFRTVDMGKSVSREEYIELSQSGKWPKESNLSNPS